MKNKLQKETRDMVEVIKEIQRKFGATNPYPSRRHAPDASTDILVSSCPQCRGEGNAKDDVFDICNKCDGEGLLYHRFAKEIVALSFALQGKTPLEIAQVLSGLAIGMTLRKS